MASGMGPGMASGGAGTMVRMLTISEVEDLVDLPGAIACLEQVFLAQARGEVTAWPPSFMRTGGAPLMLRSGGLADLGRMGVRVGTGPPNLPYALLFRSDGGALLCVMAYPFSELRLHASVALGVDRMARPGAARVALIGAGRNAPGLLEAVASIRPFTDVRVFSPNEAHRTALAERSTGVLGVPVSAVDAPERAVEDASIVIVATNAQEPALRGAWLAPDALVAAIGSRLELDDDVFLRAQRVVTTSKVQEMNIHGMRDAWPIVRLTRSGALSWDDVMEFGDVVADPAPPPGGISVFREAQGGFGDVALASLAYDRAVERGRGTEWDPG